MAALLACLGALVAAPSIAAEEPESVKPLVTISAWYWEEAEAKDFETPAGTSSIDSNNEYCPQISGGFGNASEETCAEGRLPVRIKAGDYEKPNQVSAVTFDTITTIPLGSKVLSFKATFEEAKLGCSKSDTSPSGQKCEQSQPMNVEGHELQACLVTQFFGEGAARPYREVPDHTCSKNDPVAKRKKVGDGYEWSFDLTDFAQQWAAGKTRTSGVLITGAEPKDTGSQDSWRVTLVGAADDGIAVKAQIIPADPVIPPLGPPGGPTTTTIPGTPGTPGIPGTPGTPATSGTPPSSSDDAGAEGSSDAGADTPADPGEAKAPVEAPEETIAAEPAAADQGPPGGGLPWYAWLALLAGMVGFSLLRSTVLESAAGMRPNGVLAQIQQINAQRRGGAPVGAASQPGLWAAFVGVTSGLVATAKTAGSKLANVPGMNKASSIVGKLKRIPGKTS